MSNLLVNKYLSWKFKVRDHVREIILAQGMKTKPTVRHPAFAALRSEIRLAQPSPSQYFLDCRLKDEIDFVWDCMVADGEKSPLLDALLTGIHKAFAA